MTSIEKLLILLQKESSVVNGRVYTPGTMDALISNVVPIKEKKSTGLSKVIVCWKFTEGVEVRYVR